MNEALIDRIYESCFVPEVWPAVLDELGRIGDGLGASLVIAKKDVQHCLASPEFRERAELTTKQGWFGRGQIIPRLFAQRYAGFLVDIDVFTLDELAREPIYCDFWRPRGIGWGMATAIPLPTGENVACVLSRLTDRGPFDRAAAQRLDVLRPHLARSALISARLQLENARVVSETLAIMGVPALVFDDRGRVLAANSLIEQQSSVIRWRAFDRVSLQDSRADQLLRDALAGLNAESGFGVRSFPVHGTDVKFVAHVIPVRLSARDVFVRCAAVLAMTPVTAPQAPPVELVQSLFDLTPMEARVARGLAAGQDVETMAGERDVSRNTIRTHVRGVLEKTGCNRQAEVVALLGGISRFDFDKEL